MTALRSKTSSTIPSLATIALAGWIVLFLGGQALLGQPETADLEVIKAALDDKIYEVADSQLVRFLAAHRDDPDASSVALALMCRSLAEQGRPKDVVGLIEANKELVDRDRSGGFDFWKMWALLELGRMEEVVEMGDKVDFAAVAGGYGLGMRRVMARAERELENREGARQNYEIVSKLAKEDSVRAENLVEWAQFELELGERARAEELLGELTTARGGGREAVLQGKLLRAQLARREGRVEEAEEILREMTGAEDASTVWHEEAWLELAEEAAKRNDLATLRAARERIGAGSLASRREWRVALQFGRLLITLPDEISHGATLLKRCIRSRPETPEAERMQFELAEAWLAASSNRQAAVEYQAYLETYGVGERLAAALAGQATALAKLGSYAEAAALFSKASAAAGDSQQGADWEQQAADACHAEGNYEAAARIYSRVAEVSTNSAVAERAALMAADSWERLGELAKAEDGFVSLSKGGVGVESRDMARLRLAALQERQGRTLEAVDSYSELLESTTNSVIRQQALHGRGRTYYGNYQFDLALEDLNEITERGESPIDEVEYLKILSLYGVGRDTLARELALSFTESLRESELLPEVSLWLAQSSYNAKEYEEAQRRLVEFVKEWPQHPQADVALIWAGRAAFNRGEFSEAIALLGRVSQEYQESRNLAKARFLQGNALCEQARFEEAVQVFNEIIHRYPDSESVTYAWLRKGDSLYSLASANTDYYTEALQAFEVVMRRPDATPGLVLQAAFKKGRCLEKMQRLPEALEQYYAEVILRYRREIRRGIKYSRSAQEWFAWATLYGAALEESRGRPAAAIRLLEYLANSDLKGAADASLLIAQIEEREPVRWPTRKEELSDEIK